MQITRIAKQERRDRYNIFVDGKFYAALSAELLAEAGFREGDEVVPEELDSLTARDEAGKAVTKGLSYLARRPHSEGELRDKLKHKEFALEHIDDAVARLQELGYLDDEAFAKQWAEERGRDRGTRLLRTELLKKRIPDDVIDRALSGDQDEIAAAQALAAKRLTRLSGQPPEVVRRRLTDYLARRGYQYDTIREALTQTFKKTTP